MINNNKVLALKYRPQTFDQLIGQQVASQTIFNAIKSNNSIMLIYLLELEE